MNTETFLSRRDFLRIAAGAGAIAATPFFLTGCLDEICADLVAKSDYRPEVVSTWVEKGSMEASFRSFSEMVEKATDFSWLNVGDPVMIKISVESPNRFPASTDPVALKFMIRLLKLKGAGTIYVGEQSGIEHVLHSSMNVAGNSQPHWLLKKLHEMMKADEIAWGSTRECCIAAGLLDVITAEGATPLFFEELGFDSYKELKPTGLTNWVTPVYVTTALDSVLHIINMPKVSSHFFTGTSLGMMNSIGFLRSDSRFAMLADLIGFNEKYVDICRAPEITEKLRLTVTSGRKVMITDGPETGVVVEPDYGLLFASEDLLASELLASAWLEANRPEQSEGIYCRPAIRSWMLNKGRPAKIEWTELNSLPLTDRLRYMKKLMSI